MFYFFVFSCTLFFLLLSGFLLKSCLSTWGISLVDFASDFVDPPGAPEAPEVSEITKETASLTWKPPSEDGGTPITGYVIERCQTSSTRWLRVNKEVTLDLTYKVPDLIEGNEYTFRISAENKVGQGPPCSPTSPALAKDPWGRLNHNLHSTVHSS